MASFLEELLKNNQYVSQDENGNLKPTLSPVPDMSQPTALPDMNKPLAPSQPSNPQDDFLKSLLSGQGMADSLPQRSGDDMMPPSVPPMNAPAAMPAPTSDQSTAPPMLRKEDTLNQSLNLMAQRKPDIDSGPDQALLDAQNKRDNIMALIAAGQGGDLIGTALGTRGKESATGNYLEALKPMAAAPVQRILETNKAQEDKIDRDTKKFKLAFEKDKDDPGSPSSVFTRDMLKKMGTDAGLNLNVPDNMSAAEIEKLYPSITNYMNTKEAAKSRLAVAGAKQSEKEDARQQKTDDQLKTFTRNIRKDLTQGSHGKQYDNYIAAQRGADTIEKFVQNPTGYKDYGILMSGLKSLQGDTSVVREAEMRMGMKAGSMFDKLNNEIDSAYSGKTLQPRQRQAILDAVRTLQEVTRSQYKNAVEPIVQQAKDEGVKLNQILSPDMVKEFTKSEYTPQQEAGINNFMLKNKIQDRNEAIAVLKKAGKL